MDARKEKSASATTISLGAIKKSTKQTRIIREPRKPRNKSIQQNEININSKREQNKKQLIPTDLQQRREPIWVSGIKQ